MREKVWFPSLNKLCADTVPDCIACAATTPQTKVQPLVMSELPKAPFTDVSIDFFGPLPSSEILMVVTDDYSRYPIVEIVHSTSANTVVAALDKVLSTFGIPEVVRSDNGLPFNSEQFKNYASHMGFTHRRNTPYYPQANSECERFMKTMAKILKTSKIEGKNWKQELQSFLRMYRTTPHCTTLVSPSELIFGRKLRTKIPEFQPQTPTNDTAVRERDFKMKQRIKFYADARNNATDCHLKIGDTVLVKQQRENKLTSYYNPKPLTITAMKGSMVTASSANGEYKTTRNSSFFKKLPDAAGRDNTAEQRETSHQPGRDSDTDDDVTPPAAGINVRAAPPHDTSAQAPRDAATSPRRRYPQRRRHPPARLTDYVP